MPATAASPTVHLTAQTFNEEVLAFDGVVLVDYGASWCGPCRAMAPRVKALAEKYADNPKVKIAEVDVDAEAELSQAHKVMALPTFRVFAKGQPVKQELGLIPPTVLEALLQEGLAKIGG